MTNTEVAALVAVLHGAYPGTYFDGAVAEVFTNSMLTADYDVANAVVTHWVGSMDRFPTVAELNGAMRRHRDRANQDRQLPTRGQYKTADREAAAEAFSRGYIRGRSEAGDAMEDIEPKLDRLLKQWKLAPTSEREPLEQTDSTPRRDVPSRRLPGYLRSSTAPAVDQPAFDGSSTDEPW